MTTTSMNRRLAKAMEYSEMSCWYKFFNSNIRLKNTGSSQAWAFAATIPEADILALNRVIGLGLDKRINHRDIDQIIEFYRVSGAKRFFIQLSPLVIQDDLPDLLKQKGFRHYNNWVKWARPSWKPVPAVETGLNIAPVGLEQAMLFGKIITESFQWQQNGLAEWFAQSVGKPGFRHYFVKKDETPIAAGAVHFYLNKASMVIAGTLPAYRKLGAQHLLLETRIQHAYASGCDTIISETGEEKPDAPDASYRNMRGFGFEIAYLRQNWIMEL